MPSAKSNANAKHGVKRSRSVDVVRGADDPKSKQLKLTPSTHTAQLSGATRNMRFMQRGKTANIVTSRHSYPPKPSMVSSTTETATKEETISKIVDGDVYERQSDHLVNDSMEANTNGSTNDLSNGPKVNISSIKWEKATPLDMFGPTTCIFVGRRSYNGFNSITASNLYMQQQHLEYEEKLKRRSTPTRGGVTKHISSTGKSDQQRYKELSKQVQKETKLTLLSKNGGKVANKKVRNLDKILKSVDA
jgi:hypothetical protein